MQIKLLSLFAVIVIYVEFSRTSELWCSKNEYRFISSGVVSDFMCYNDQSETFYQSCRKIYFSQNENCSHHTFKLPEKNFRKFFDGDDFFHFKLTSPEFWNATTCYGSDTTLFDLNVKKQRFILNYIIHKENTREFWIPGYRRRSFGPAVWDIPGKMWAEQIKQNYDELSPSDCVSLIVTLDLQVKISMRNCNDRLPKLCISKGSPIIQSRCNYGSVALRYIPDVCYFIIRRHYQVPAVSYQNYLVMKENQVSKYIATYFELVPGEKCSIYRSQSNNFTVMLNSTGGLDRIYGIQQSNCAIGITTIPRHEDITMILSFNPSIESLLLTVYNPKEIWCDESDPNDSSHESCDCGIKCFTNAEYQQLSLVKIKDLVWEDENKAVFELKLYGDGPGEYWCESHSIHNFELITSAKIIASKKQKGHPFSFFFNLPCHLVPCDRINLNMKNYGKTIRTLLTDLKNNPGVYHKFKNLDIHNVRVMSIESVIPGDHINVLCHAMVSLKGSSVDNSSEEDDSEYIDEVKNKFEREIQMRSHMKQLFGDLVGASTYGITNMVNSTEFCFAETSVTLSRSWQPTKIGTSTTTYELCLLSNGLPIFRKCIGDFLYGATWELIDRRMKCSRKIVKKIITNDLYEIDRMKSAEDQPLKVINNIVNLVSGIRQFIPADVFYLGRIMQSVANTIITSLRGNPGIPKPTEPTVFPEDTNSTEGIIRIFNRLMDMDTQILKPSIKLNSTNNLLDAFETIFNRISMRNETHTAANHSSDGVIIHRSSKLIALIIDPTISNYSGVALFSNEEGIDFSNSHIRLLFSNQSEFELLEENDLEIAAFVPATLLDRLDEIPSKINGTQLIPRPPIKIVIKIYFNDKFFQEDRDIVNNRVFNRIISISIPGYDSNLPEQVPLFMKSRENNGSESLDSCRYWNYATWAQDGLQFVSKSASNNNVVLCGCSHLTPFAYLVGGSYNISVSSDHVIITELHREALDMITVLGCSLSLVGIMGIIITAIIFDKWREKPTSKVIVNFSIAIALQMILFCFVNTEVLTMHLLDNEIFSSCIILGACLHYSVLVQFSWMLIIAYLQYKRYVQVLGNTRPPRFFIKAFLLGWCLPILPVALVIMIDMKSYIPIDNRDQSQICYPSGQGLYFGVILPIILIIAANLIIFLLVIFNIIRGTEGKIRQVDRSSALSQVRLSILLFFLLGFTWIFGLLAAAKISLAFSYLFSLTATLQGFVMFIYFIVLDPVTRKMWSRFLKALCSNGSSK